MAAGTIVGARTLGTPSSAARNRGGAGTGGSARSGTNNLEQRRPSSRREGGRLNAHGSRADGPLCRAQLVTNHEGHALVRLPDLLPSEVGAAAHRAKLVADAGLPPPCSVWLVLTINALAVYDGASRRTRLAIYPLRKLCNIEGTESTDCAGKLLPIYTITLSFLSDLDATERRPTLPLQPLEEAAARLAHVPFLFASHEQQQHWLRLLRQAMCPSTLPSTELNSALHPAAPTIISPAIPAIPSIAGTGGLVSTLGLAGSLSVPHIALGGVAASGLPTTERSRTNAHLPSAPAVPIPVPVPMPSGGSTLCMTGAHPDRSPYP